MEIINIKKLPPLERPREKARYYGIEKLSNNELLALIIGSGSKDANALMIANNLLIKANGINNLLNLSFNEFLSVNGIKEATAFRFLAINELLKRRGLNDEKTIYIHSQDIAKRYRYLIGSNNQESMHLIGVNNKSNIIFEKELYRGTKTNLISSEEEIIAICRRMGVSYFLLIHNHPSQDARPSQSDIISTNHLYIYAKKQKIILLDHIIVANKDEYYSFKESDSLINA